MEARTLMPNQRPLNDRLRQQASEWGVVVDSVRETPSSLIAFGRRDATAVVLKLVKHEGDEWFSGEVAEAFAGQGVVRVYQHTGGAILLERLSPGHSLVDLSQSGEDEAATEIIARVVAAMAPSAIPERCVTIAEWGKSFGRYLATNDEEIQRPLVLRAQQNFADLARSESEPRLLHGDLQHSNVLFDHDRGWIAIDPKGVVGDLAYELGAVFRNPQEERRLFTDAGTIERRLRQLTVALHVDATRVLGWAFAQAVLSAVWDWEDGGLAETRAPTLLLAQTLDTMLHPS
jgi:streptomycin 6-kinase